MFDYNDASDVLGIYHTTQSSPFEARNYSMPADSHGHEMYPYQ